MSLTPGLNHRVELSDNANGTVIADAITFHDPAVPGNVAAYTPALSQTGAYRIYVRWPNVANDFATNAPFTIHHDGGSTQIGVNQTAGSGQWTLLGTFNLTPGQNHRLGLR